MSVVDPFSDPSTVKPLHFQDEDPYELNDNFLEVSPELHTSSDWSLRFSQYMKYPEAITVLEGRAVLASLRHKFRSVGNFHQQHAHLCDNLGTVLAIEKGRSASMGLLRVCRRIACLLLATCSTLGCRWIPSEVNTADAGSRRWEHLRKGNTGGGTELGHKFKVQGSQTKGSSTSQQPGQPKLSSGPTATNQCQESGTSSGEEPSAEDQSSTSGSEQTRTCRKTSSLPCGSERPFAFQGTELPGNAVSHSGCSLGLPDSHVQIPTVCKTTEAESKGAQESGHSIRRVFERTVFNRHRPWRRKQAPSRPSGQRARLFRQEAPPEEQAMSTRLDKIRSRTNKTSNPMGTDSSDGLQHVGTSLHSKRNHDLTHVRCIPSTGRSLRNSSKRSGFANCECTTPLHQSASVRRCLFLQDGVMRRNHSTGRCNSGLDGAVISNMGKCNSRDYALRNGLPSVQSRMGSDPSTRWPKPQACRPSPAASLRTFLRHVEEEPDLERGQAAWPVAKRLISEALRRACQAKSGVQKTPQKCSKVIHDGATEVGNHGPKIFMPEESNDRRVWFVEIFSGSAHLSQAMAQHGFRCAAWDIDYNDGCDILQVDVLAALFRFCVNKPVYLVWLGMPCQSWSRARRWDGGPAPLRDDHDYLYGRPKLPYHDAEKVFTGNVLLFWTYWFCTFATHCGLRWVVEVPSLHDAG